MNYSYISQTVEQQVHHLICEIYDIQGLQPAEFSNKAQKFVNSGFETDIINHLMESIKQFAGERNVKKYIHVADKMLKMPIFNQLLQHVIVQIFSDIFIFLLIQKCYNQLDQIKILRKFWVKTIHPRLLSAMREAVYEKTKIDVDNQFKRQAIAHIKNYYQTKLQLSKNQMEFYLPKTIKTSHSVYQNKFKSNNQNFINNQNLYFHTPQHNHIVPTKNNQIQNLGFYPGQNSYIDGNCFSISSSTLSQGGMRGTHSQTLYQQQLKIMLYHQQQKKMLQKPANYYIEPQNKVYQKSYNGVMNPLDYNLAHSYVSITPSNSSNPYSSNIRQKNNYTYHQEERQNIKRQRLASQQTKVSFYNDPFVISNQANQYFIAAQNNRSSQQKQAYSHTSFINSNKAAPTIVQDHQFHSERQFSNDRDNFSSSSQQPIIRKIVHKNQNAFSSYESERLIDQPKYLNIRQRLNESNQFNCKECGKSFLTKKHMDIHIDQHFQDKISQYEKNKRGKKLNSLTVDEWTNISGHLNLQFDQFYISVSLISSEFTLQLKCALCDQTFQRVVRNDQWVFNNATFCEPMDKPMMEKGKKFLMHKSCQQILDESSSSEQQPIRSRSK